MYPPETILRKFREATQADVAIAGGYAPDGSKRRVLFRVGPDPGFEKEKRIDADAGWQLAFAAHRKNEFFGGNVDSLPDGSTIKSECQELGLTYMMSYPIRVNHKAVGGIFGLWTKPPDFDIDELVALQKCALNFQDFITPQGFEAFPTPDQLTAQLLEEAAQFKDLAPIILGLDPNQVIMVFYDKEDFFGFKDVPPMRRSMGVLFEDADFVIAHQALLNSFEDDDRAYRNMGTARFVPCRGADGNSRKLTVMQIRKIDAKCSRGYLALCMPHIDQTKPLLTISETRQYLPQLNDDDSDDNMLFKKIKLGEQVVSNVTKNFEVNRMGALLLTLFIAVVGLIAYMLYGLATTERYEIRHDIERPINGSTDEDVDVEYPNYNRRLPNKLNDD